MTPETTSRGPSTLVEFTSRTKNVGVLGGVEVLHWRWWLGPSFNHIFPFQMLKQIRKIKTEIWLCLCSSRYYTKKRHPALNRLYTLRTNAPDLSIEPAWGLVHDAFEGATGPFTASCECLPPMNLRVRHMMWCLRRRSWRCQNKSDLRVSESDDIEASTEENLKNQQDECLLIVASPEKGGR